MDSFLHNKIVQAVLVFCAVVGLYTLFLNAQYALTSDDSQINNESAPHVHDDSHAHPPTDMMDMGNTTTPADPYAGTHIMPDGTVMLGTGETIPEAVINDDGSVEMPDGTILENVPDMRP